MNLPQPLKLLAVSSALYVLSVLFFRYGRSEMAWTHAFLVALAAVPAMLLLSWVRDHWNDRARETGRRWRERRHS
ncbi:hypothetical protein ABZ920_11980 [Streptomyces sp. NPDC046831]|uniref:hypothetical protein n=1 Tax=Streptomyces sp. NPDC046831 TaxID=3154805 RepID=UPI0033DB158D